MTRQIHHSLLNGATGTRFMIHGSDKSLQPIVVLRSSDNEFRVYLDTSILFVTNFMFLATL